MENMKDRHIQSQMHTEIDSLRETTKKEGKIESQSGRQRWAVRVAARDGQLERQTEMGSQSDRQRQTVRVTGRDRQLEWQTEIDIRKQGAAPIRRRQGMNFYENNCMHHCYNKNLINAPKTSILCCHYFWNERNYFIFPEQKYYLILL